MLKRFFAAVMAFAAVSATIPARAATPDQLGAAARQIQAACVERGDPAIVCACGVGLASAKLDPRVFLLLPRIEPLLEEKNQMLAIAQLSSILQGSGLSASDGFAAYETIRDNRETVRNVCRPLAPQG